jgi:hypothetical protein
MRQTRRDKHFGKPVVQLTPDSANTPIRRTNGKASFLRPARRGDQHIDDRPKVSATSLKHPTCRGFMHIQLREDGWRKMRWNEDVIRASKR